MVEVKFKPISGKEDQAGGIAWRWKDGDNYYVARANALENNVSLYYTAGGRRNTIKYVDAPVAKNQWHTLRVEFAEIADRALVKFQPGDSEATVPERFRLEAHEFEFRSKAIRSGARFRVLHVKFPSPFLRNEPMLVVTEGMDDGVAWEKTALVSYEEAFKQELIHFHDCIANGRRPRTDGEDGKRDVVLLRDLTLAWQRAQQQR